MIYTHPTLIAALEHEAREARAKKLFPILCALLVAAILLAVLLP